MHIRNEEFVVRFATLIDGKKGNFASFLLSQECPRNPSRTVDYKLLINGGKAEAAINGMPVGTVVNIAEGMVTNSSYKKGDNSPWVNQNGILLTGKLTVVKKADAPSDTGAHDEPDHVDESNLPF